MRVLSRFVECDVCESGALTNKAHIPVGWGILFDSPYTLCADCLELWREKFESEPSLLVLGGEPIDLI